MRVLLVNGAGGSDESLESVLRARDCETQTVKLTDAPSTLAKWRPAVVIAWIGAGESAVNRVVTLRAATDAALVAVVREAEFLDCVDIYDAGADDCLVEPVTVDHLVQGVAALARARRTAVPGAPSPEGHTSIGDDHGADDSKRLPARLLPIERRILDALSHRPGRAVTRRQLLDDVWGPARRRDESYLRFYLTMLRRKLEHSQPGWRLITDVGGGYRLQPATWSAGQPGTYHEPRSP
jgi:two-component system KDP operon response regulator KdpE